MKNFILLLSILTIVLSCDNQEDQLSYSSSNREVNDTIFIDGKVFLKLGQEAHIIGAYDPQIMQFEMGVREEGVLGFYFNLVDTANGNLQNFVEVISNYNNGYPIGHAYFGSYDAINHKEITQGVKVSNGKAISHITYSDYNNNEAISFQVSGEDGATLGTGRQDYSFSSESMFRVIDPATKETIFQIFSDGSIIIKAKSEEETLVGRVYEATDGTLKIKQ